jgi:hypothetical protein
VVKGRTTKILDKGFASYTLHEGHYVSSIPISEEYIIFKRQESSIGEFFITIGNRNLNTKICVIKTIHVNKEQLIDIYKNLGELLKTD